MRLLNVHTCELHTFYGDSIPKYAILSHTWLQDHEEVTFGHIQSQYATGWRDLPGARKIELTLEQAARHGHSWAWVDTCCIDKTNSSELSEAINSMFEWYQTAAVCYVFLTDVDVSCRDDLLQSRWWTRAWTLQELLAPDTVQFFDKNWQYIGTKSDTADQIAHATNIDRDTLCNPTTMFSKSVAQRMSWAAHREATRAEDLAYSLLGVFQINMTMQYGEGERAFVRLQKEIMHSTEDLSLFAWGFIPKTLDDLLADFSAKNSRKDLNYFVSSDSISPFGVFASHPSDYAGCKDVEFLHQHNGDVHAEERHGNLTLQLPMISQGYHKVSTAVALILPSSYWIALLSCRSGGEHHELLGLLCSGFSKHRFEQRDSAAQQGYEHEFQGIRSIFQSSPVVATFLVNRELAVNATETRIRVDSRARKLHDRDQHRNSVIQRTLVFKTWALENSAITYCRGQSWEVIKQRPHLVLTLNDQDYMVRRISTTFRYTTEAIDQPVNICVELSRSPDVADGIGLGLRQRDPPCEAGRSDIVIPGKEKILSATIETRRVYNIAVSTIMIQLEGALGISVSHYE